MGLTTPQRPALFKNKSLNLIPRLFLLAAEQSDKGHTSHLDDLETNTGNITDGVPTTTESSNENLIVLFDKVQATIIRDEGSNLLSVFNELHTGALTNSRVRLFGLNSTAGFRNIN
jgi:hypothetical protein